MDNGLGYFTNKSIIYWSFNISHLIIYPYAIVDYFVYNRFTFVDNPNDDSNSTEKTLLKSVCGNANMG